MNEELREKLEELSKDGRIECAAARKLAEDLGLKYDDVGKAANEIKIRIMSCELGCF